jgi:hypothetical protein
MRRNTSAAAKAMRLLPSYERVVDGQAFQQRSSLSHDVIVVAGLRAEQCGLQRPRVTHARRAAVTLHQHRVHAQHIGHGQVIVMPRVYLANSR